MRRILFVPLNTNHVLIFAGIAEHLGGECRFVCHDPVADAPQYRTGKTMERLGLPFKCLPAPLRRSPEDGWLKQAADSRRLRTRIRALLEEERPAAVVLGIDHDPIARIFIEEARRLKAVSALVQEGLIRPRELAAPGNSPGERLRALGSAFGLHVGYGRFGFGGSDIMLLSGPRARRILAGLGIPPERMLVTGQPKYDAFIRRVGSLEGGGSNGRVFLYAASTQAAADERHRRFLTGLAEGARRLGATLRVRLHPRGPHGPEEVRRLARLGADDPVEFDRGGDDTFEALRRADVLVTVSSTVVLEALLMRKECLVADYLAGDSRLDYGVYGAVHSLGSEEEIRRGMEESLARPTGAASKLALLEDELFALDGRSGPRAAAAIDALACGLVPSEEAPGERAS